MRHRAASLLLLLWIGTGCAGSDPGTAVRTLRIWSGQNPDFLIGDISPDGRYLAETDWDSGDLRLVDLETGGARPVTGEGYAAGGYAWTSAFSSDGRRLAVAWYLNEAATHELRVMNRDGGGAAKGGWGQQTIKLDVEPGADPLMLEGGRAPWQSNTTEP